MLVGDASVGAPRMVNGAAKPARMKARMASLIKIDFGAEQDGRPFSGNRKSQEYEGQRFLVTGNSFDLQQDVADLWRAAKIGAY